MSGGMNTKDLRRHVGVVIESGDDMTLAVSVPSLADQVIDLVRPEVIGPVRWRPREGQRVVIYERIGPLRPDIALTWVGYEHDPQSGHLTPTYLDSGKVHIVSEDATILVALEDDTEDTITLPTNGGETLAGPFLRLATKDAAEPVMLGLEHKDWAENLIDDIEDLRAQAEATATAAESYTQAVQTYAAQAVIAWGGLLGPPPAQPAQAAADWAIAAASAEAAMNAAASALNAIAAELVDRKDEIEQHLSRCVFAPRDPDATAIVAAGALGMGALHGGGP